MKKPYPQHEEQKAGSVAEPTATYGIPAAVAEIWQTIQGLSSSNKRWIADHLLEDEAKGNESKVLEESFHCHYQAWVEETSFLSSTRLIRGNAHFKAMVAMGMDVVPYIVQQLKKEPSHLCWVLTEIFQEPITTQPLTNAEVCRLWIEKLSA